MCIEERRRREAYNIFENSQPQFYFRTTDVIGRTKLLDVKKMVMPGDNARVEVGLQVSIAMNEGLRFAIREGARTIGSGVVSEILK